MKSSEQQAYQNSWGPGVLTCDPWLTLRGAAGEPWLKEPEGSSLHPAAGVAHRILAAISQPFF